jgi:hypothetical protein
LGKMAALVGQPDRGDDAEAGTSVSKAWRVEGVDGSRDGGCAQLDDRRRFELVQDDEDGARRRRVAQGRRPRLAPRRLEEVIGQGGGLVRRMGMAARGCGAVLRTASVLSEWRGAVGFERRAWR